MAVKKATLASNWLSVTDVIQRLGRARENRDQHAKLLNTLEGQVTQRRIDVERSLADLPSNERSKVVTRAVNGHRAELRRKSADARLALVREAGRIRDEVAAVRMHFESPMQMLIRRYPSDPLEAAFVEDQAAWCRSKSYDQGKWHRVRKLIRQKVAGR